jgi:uncharacterized protein
MPGSTVPDFNLRINGSAMTSALKSDIVSVTVQEDLDALSMFTLELFNWKQEGDNARATWGDSSLLAVGNEVEIWLGYVDDLHKVMLAEITSLEAVFSTDPDQEDLLTVRGYDYRNRLARGRKTRTFAKVKDSAIASQVASGAGLRAQVKDTQVQLPFVVQSNQTDWEFVQSRANRIGYEVFVKDKVLYFQPPQITSQATVKLHVDDVGEFRPRLSASAQVGEVAVRGWDVKQKQVILGTATVGQELGLMGGKASGPRTANRAFGKASIVGVDQPVQSKAEADQIARGRFNEMALSYIEGNVVGSGRPQLHAGTVIEMNGAGKMFSGAYYVTSVTHTLTPDDGYKTEFTVKRNAA